MEWPEPGCDRLAVTVTVRVRTDRAELRQCDSVIESEERDHHL